MIPGSIQKTIQKQMVEAVGKQFAIEMTIAQEKDFRKYLKSQFYHYIFIGVQAKQQVGSLLALIRICDIRSKIVLYGEQEIICFDYQKYDIYYYIRSDNFEVDCEGLYYAVKQIHQNKVLFLHKVGRPLIIHSIFYIESNKNYLILHTKEGNIKDRSTLKELWGLYCEIRTFIPINKSQMVNPYHILYVEGKTVCLRNQDVLYISRSKMESVYTMLKMNYYLTAE